jgi:hypothetical protein
MLRAIAIMILARSLYNEMNPYASWAGKQTASILVNTEYYEYTNCSKQNSGEKVAILKDGRMSVARKDADGKYFFEIRDCN